MGAGTAFVALLVRDLRCLARRPGTALHPLLFFCVTATLFPLALGPEGGLLRQVAPGLMWIAALLSALLSLEGLFQADYEEGFLDQLLLAPQPLPLMAGAKILAHWIATGLPLLLVAPLLGLLLHLDGGALGVLVATLLLGTPVLSLVGTVGAALTLSQRRGGALLSLLLLPLFVPVLVFGAGAVAHASHGMTVAPELSLLGAMLLLALAFAPPAAAAALRIALE